MLMGANDHRLGFSVDTGKGHAQGRVFMAFVLSTLGGVGPPSPTVEWVDSLFHDSRAQEFAATGSTSADALPATSSMNDSATASS